LAGVIVIVRPAVKIESDRANGTWIEMRAR
jgi:hypothetical protein